MRAMLTNAKGFNHHARGEPAVVCQTVLSQEFTVNLKDTDIQEFIEFVADVTAPQSS